MACAWTTLNAGRRTLRVMKSSKTVSATLKTDSYQTECCRCSTRDTKHKQQASQLTSTLEKMNSWGPCDLYLSQVHNLCSDSYSDSWTLKVWNHLAHTPDTEAKQGSNSGNQTYEPCLNTCKHCTMEGLTQASKKTSLVILTLVTQKVVPSKEVWFPDV